MTVILEQKQQKQKSAKRLFNRLAGSGLAVIGEAPPAVPTPVIPDAKTLLQQIESEKREKKNKKARERRKKKREQLAAIKKALAEKSVTEFKKELEEKAKAEKERMRLPSMNGGKFMTDAPTGKGELTTGGYDWNKIVLTSNARESNTGRVVPQGVGHRPGGREENDIPDACKDFRDNRTESGGDADILPGKKFKVKLNDIDWDWVLWSVVCIYCVENELKSDEYICRLCKEFLDGKETAKNHFEDVHGDESEPGHDDKFGDVVLRYIKKAERDEARLRKAGRQKALEAAAEKHALAEAGAIRSGYIKMNGKWVPKPVTG
jgi:hypothetical protein